MADPRPPGAPIGNTNAARGTRWRHAIERAVDAWPERAVSLQINKGLDEAAYVFVSEMIQQRDIAFFREFGDRIDGKVTQTLAGDPDLPPVVQGAVVLVKPPGEGE